MNLNNINASYGERIVFKDFTLTIKDDEITSILGPSGCGKTTLLRVISQRFSAFGVSQVFQEPRLIPWKTLEQNIMLICNGSVKQKKEKALLYLERVGLQKRGGEYPGALSGGERQRVSIARSFAYQAPLLLMDEPFQSQDTATKKQLIELILKLQLDEKRTIIAVTHDIREAIDLSERIVVLKGKPASIAYDSLTIKSSELLETEISEVLAHP